MMWPIQGKVHFGRFEVEMKDSNTLGILATNMSRYRIKNKMEVQNFYESVPLSNEKHF